MKHLWESIEGGSAPIFAQLREARASEQITRAWQQPHGHRRRRE